MLEFLFDVLITGIFETIGEVVIGLFENPGSRKRKIKTVPVINGEATFQVSKLVSVFGYFFIAVTAAIIGLIMSGIFIDLVWGIPAAVIFGLLALLLTLSSLERIILDDRKIIHRNLFGAVTEIRWDEVVSVARRKNDSGYVIHGHGKKKIANLRNFIGYEQLIKIIRKKCKHKFIK